MPFYERRQNNIPQSQQNAIILSKGASYITRLLRTTERVQTLHLRVATQTNYNARVHRAYSASDGVPDVIGPLTNQSALIIFIEGAALIIIKCSSVVAHMQ